MPGATTAPLDQLSEPSAWANYCRTSTKLLRWSFSLPFSSSQWPGRRRVSRHVASHSSAVPALIRDFSRALALGAHTARTQPPSLGAPKATLTPWCVCVCVCVCVCMCVCVTYILSTLILVHTIYVVNYLRLTNPFVIPAIQQL